MSLIPSAHPQSPAGEGSVPATQVQVTQVPGTHSQSPAGEGSVAATQVQVTQVPSTHSQSPAGEGSVPASPGQVTRVPTGTDFGVHHEEPEGPGRGPIFGVGESGSKSILRRGSEVDVDARGPRMD